MIDFIVKGGIFMYPIILCSIFGLAVFLERLWVLRRKPIIPTEFIRNIEDLLRKQKITEAIFLSEQNGSSIARVFAAGLKNASRGMWLVKESIEDVGGREAIGLEKRLTTLSTIANVSNLLVLMGTISGSGVANTATIGTLTIPLMKKVGSSPSSPAATASSCRRSWERPPLSWPSF